MTASMQQHGHDPNAFGDIEGYLLRSGQSISFFVRGGKHRAAAMTHLGFEKIPVAFRQRFPRIVDAGQASYWPLVANGQISKQHACEILDAYCNGRTREDFLK